MEEADIMQRIKNGDRTVFGELVATWQDMVYNTALGIVQNEADAEDVTQDVFIKIHESLANFNAQAKLSTWIYRITVNKALDAEKQKRRQKRGGFLKRIFEGNHQEEIVSFDHPGVTLDKKEDARVLFKALNKLPEKQKLAFVLQKMEGLPNDEIAMVMELSLTAVESLQARARANLKNLLKEYYEHHFK